MKKLYLFLFALAVVAGFFFLQPYLSGPAPSPADESIQGASFSLAPPSYSAKFGEVFPVEAILNTGGNSIVAASAYLNYDPAVLGVDRIDYADSVFGIQAEEEAGGGSIKLTRGEPTPGVTGQNLKMAKIYFEAKASGSTKIDFVLTASGQGPSRIILDDGQGTDILESVSGGVYSISSYSNR